MKTVLITGASRGIGRAAAKRFAKQGYNVAINYCKSKGAAESICDEIRQNGGRASIFCADVADNSRVQEMIEAVECEMGTIDVLINNAGIAPKQGLFTDFSENDVESVFATNIFGMMNCARAVIPKMVSKKSGKIINVSSIWGICGGSCEVLYSSAKAAVIGFTKSLAKELAPSGITVNAVAPGFIDTDMNSHLSEEDKKLFCEDIPLQRIGTAEEVAETLLFLASDSASYITGQVLTVDGGLI